MNEIGSAHSWLNLRKRDNRLNHPHFTGHIFSVVEKRAELRTLVVVTINVSNVLITNEFHTVYVALDFYLFRIIFNAPQVIVNKMQVEVGCRDEHIGTKS